MYKQDHSKVTSILFGSISSPSHIQLPSAQTNPYAKRIAQEFAIIPLKSNLVFLVDSLINSLLLVLYLKAVIPDQENSNL